ncbi:MAG TPA: hypothetical protein DDW27_15230 [Bacteroidales bacterium]|nr:hypothetical protein [Bacteroidales bacterium]
MDKCIRLHIVILFLFIKISIFPDLKAQHPTIGGYNIYYGHIHNHTCYSDGLGTPAEAYSYARYVAGLDFFGLADHSDAISSAEWSDTKAQADIANSDGVYTTFYGFEWTSSTDHITVVNTEDYTTVALNPTFSDLVTWVSDKNTVAFFNHPARGDYFGYNSYNSAITPSIKFVGMELWNYIHGFSYHYYVDGYIPNDNKGCFDEALTNGWILGAMGSGDDHMATWGTAQDYRMAILADSLTRTNLFEAMKVRRFYSTLESDIRLSFKINGKEMGSAIPAGSYNLQIQAADGGGEAFTKVVLYDQDHNRLKTWTPQNCSFTITDNINTVPGDYYYVKVLQADSTGCAGQAISSPIFVTSMKSDGPQTLMICPETCTPLESNISGGYLPYSYKWSPSTGLSSTSVSNPVACPAINTTYQVTVTDAIGCTVTNEITVNIIPLPTVDAGSSLYPICPGGTSAALGGSIGGSATGCVWSSDAGGTFYPDSTSLNATWTPPEDFTGTAVLTLKTNGGLCNTEPAKSSKIQIVELLPSIVIYPNPASSYVTIEIRGNTENIDFEIYNYTGKIVLQGTMSDKITLPARNLIQGLYLIKFRFNKHVVIERVFIR